MLRIDKKSHGTQVHLELISVAEAFNSSFFRALGIAFLIHAGALALFQISPFKIRYAEAVFPPVEVNVDTRLASEGTVTADPEPDAYLDFSLAYPRQSLPKIHSAVPPSRRLPESPKLLPIHAPPFQEYYGSLYADRIRRLSPPHFKMPPISVRLTGEWAERTFTMTPLPPELLDSYGKKRSFEGGALLSYRIKVDPHTGKIFWFSKISGESKRKLEALSERILASITFHTQPPESISEGEIEIALNPKHVEQDP